VTEDFPTLALVSTRLEITHLAFRLQEGTFVLGRSTDCELVVPFDSVSRRHAEIAVENGKVHVRDLGSRNGTFIDNHRIRSGTLDVGRHLRFGSIAFVLQQVDGVLAEHEEMETSRITEDSRESLWAKRDKLTEAQRRVYDLLIDGSSEKEIAAQLHLSTNTVHSHIQAIFAIVGVHSKPKLIALARQL